MTRNLRRALHGLKLARWAYGHTRKKSGKRGASKARRKVGKALCRAANHSKEG